MALGYLVRHAQTDWNLENRLQGHSDLPLNALGRSQAEGVARYFSVRPIEAVYTSHLARSRQTAAAIGERAGLAPTVEPALAEIHLGAWEGLTPEEINARFGGAYEAWKTTPSQVTIPEAEPLGGFRRRVLAATQRIFTRHPSGNVAIVTHGGVISSLLAEWLEADYDRLLRRLSLDNGGVSALNYHAQPPHILWINDTAHLSRNGDSRAIDAPAASAGD